MAFGLEDPPDLGINQLLEPEQYEAGHLWNLLDDLRLFTIEFEGAVRILDHCEAELRATNPDHDLDEYWLWSYGRHIPARDAALSVYQFGWTLVTSIPGTLRRCPTISALADHTALRAVRRDFQKCMGNYTLLRNAVGHRAELRQTREKQQSNAALNPHSGRGETIWGNLEARSLVFTIGGQRVSLPITVEMRNALADFTIRTYAAFPIICSSPNKCERRLT